MHTSYIRIISYFLVISVLFTSCVSSTIIRSFPEGADLRIDGIDVGQTPYRYEDSKIAFSSTDIRLSKEGYRSYNDVISKDEEVDIGPAIAGFFVVIPWLWVMKYRSSYTFNLKPEVPQDYPVITIAPPAVDSTTKKTNDQSNSKLERLRELKLMADEGLITQEDYEMQKKKILAE
jgi:hypothetical protein